MRLRLPLALLLALAVLAAACGDDGGTADDGDDADQEAADLPECPVGAHEDADGPVEVTVWHSYVAETRDTLIELADEYNASQDRVTVEIQSQGQSYEELARKYTQAIPSGDLPGIAIMEDTQTQFLADSGTIVPGQSCFDAAGISLDGYLPIGVEYYTVDGALQPASLNLSTVLMYYNKEHFRQAGLDPEDPPGTLEEVRQVSQAIKDAGVTEQPLVMNMQPWFVEHWMTGADAPIVNNDNGRAEGGATAADFDNETAVEIYDWLDQMVADGLLNAVPGTEGQFDHYFAVALEQASMTFETSTATTTIDAVLEGTLDPSDLGIDIEEIPAIDLDIGAAVYPALDGGARAGQVGGGVWYIPNTSPDEVQAGAWDFIAFVNSPESQVKWNLQGSYLPWNLAAVDEPELQDAWENTRKGRWLSMAYDALLDIDPGWPGPLIGPYTETREEIRTGLDAMLFDGTAPADAVAEADQAITEAIEQYNDENF